MTREVLRALEPAALELSVLAIDNIELERKRLHDQWRQKLERAKQDVARAERQYHAVEPENRLVARTLEARWEDALKRQRHAEEEYHRVLAEPPPTLDSKERDRILSLSHSVAELWHAPGTSAVDRKQIVRCVVERVIVAAHKATELNDVTIVWHGGMMTPIRSPAPSAATSNSDYRRLTERIRELHATGLHHFQIADALNRGGFVPPRRRNVFTAGCIGDVVRRLGLTGELFRDDMLRDNEWWIPDLARKLGVIAVKVHFRVKRGWIHRRRTPTGKYVIV